MANALFKNIKITGIAATVPRSIVNNFDAHPELSHEEKEKTIKLSGILEYRKTDEKTCTSDLCQKSAETLLTGLNLNPQTIDALLFVSQTPDYRMPATACLLQDKLHCTKNTIAFDINLGCSGFIYGMYIACSFIEGGNLNKVLLLCGDTQTKLGYEKDKNVNFILGDAGTATLIESTKHPSPINISLMTDGSRYNKLIVPAAGFRHPTNDSTRKIMQQPDGSMRSLEHLFMDGMEIFTFSINDVVQTIKNFLDKNKLDINIIDYLILHQANKFMTDKIARKLGFPLNKVPYSLDFYGNTASASIPLTIAKHFAQIKPQIAKRCLLSGFGVGLSWGVIDIILENIYTPPIMEM